MHCQCKDGQTKGVTENDIKLKSIKRKEDKVRLSCCILLLNARGVKSCPLGGAEKQSCPSKLTR